MASNAMHTFGQKKGRSVHENQCQHLGCARTPHEQGIDCVGCASGISTALGSDVTSFNNENPSIIPFFSVVYLN
jgi:hypothetical protein